MNTPARLQGKTIGCIGCGAMGSALLGGLAGLPDLLLLGYNRNRERLKPLEAKGVLTRMTLIELARNADIILLGVKPYAVEPVLREALDVLTPDKILVSMAAGVTVAELRSAVQDRCPVVRIMPNTPALVNAGVFALCLEDRALLEEQRQMMVDLFSLLGSTVILPEEKFHAFTALVGCGPAYVFYVMDALAEAGVSLGFPREEALLLVSQLMLGSAKLAAESGVHPALLREQVCSPAGVTIAAINHMDRVALRGQLIDAVFAAYNKDKGNS